MDETSALQPQTVITPTRQTANRNLSQLFVRSTFGDSLVANIFGTQAVISMSDPMDSVIPALNLEPYTFQQNPVQAAQDTAETVTKEETGPVGPGPGFWDRLSSVFSGITNPASYLPDTSGIEDTAVKGAKYTLLAIIALILLVFGLYLLVKDSIPKIVAI